MPHLSGCTEHKTKSLIAFIPQKLHFAKYSVAKNIPRELTGGRSKGTTHHTCLHTYFKTQLTL